jgi:hypothetical protein
VDQEGVDDSTRGAAAVEFALVAPLVIFLLFAIVEAGFGFSAMQTSTIAVSDAARAGSIARDAPDADQQVLAVLASRLDGLAGAEVVRVVTYEATSPSGEPPAACRSGTSVAGCNVYPGAVLGNPASATCSGWCPSQRATGDLLGVWVATEYDGMSGMTPMTFVFRDSAVVGIEPRIVE